MVIVKTYWFNPLSKVIVIQIEELHKIKKKLLALSAF